ncbi:hypothetical protein [Nocardiopsis sp. YSL2]|uniref:hypothetical protein n=1 Tax=Nocardiopsis sp. YSL2 TaxID=2939492 RepID=UPI0026F41D1F|nr:hypothetical protein [Nocardiopsis sp. YSL2]
MADVKLPYRYTDEDGDEMVVDSGRISLAKGNRVAIVKVPVGLDAVALVEAVLAAAGLTGYRVLSPDEVEAIARASARHAALNMRHRSAQAAVEAPGTPYTPAEAITALSVLPDDEAPAADDEVEALREQLAKVTRDRDLVVRELGKALTSERAERLTVRQQGTAHRVAQLEKDMGRLERDRAEDQARLALLDDRVRSAEAELGPVVWSDEAAPGGYVCAAPTPSGMCGQPIESEPCREHALAGQLAAVIDRVNALEDTDRGEKAPAGTPTRADVEPSDDDEYRHCGATRELPSGDEYACARRIGHDGRCSPHRDRAEGGEGE